MSIQMNSQVYNIPCNHGYMDENNRKVYGKGAVSDPIDIVIVDPRKRELNRWTRSGYCRYSLSDDENCWDGLKFPTTRERGRAFITSRKMVVCPFELETYGECSHRFDPVHEEHHYHLAKRTRSGHVKYYQGKPVCRYSQTNQNHLCWERYNGLHNNVFHHTS